MDARQTMNEALALWQQRMPKGARGYSTSEIDAHEATLIKPLPWEIRLLYETMTPELWAQATHDAREPSLLPLERLVWNNSLDEELAERTGPGEPSWMVFGAFGYGDPLVWCDEHSGGLRRAILLVF